MSHGVMTPIAACVAVALRAVLQVTSQVALDFRWPAVARWLGLKLYWGCVAVCTEGCMGGYIRMPVAGSYRPVAGGFALRVVVQAAEICERSALCLGSLLLGGLWCSDGRVLRGFSFGTVLLT